MRPHRIARLGIGRTFQNLRILPNMTVFDNVSIGALAAFGHARLAGADARPAARAPTISELTRDVLEQVHLFDQAGSWRPIFHMGGASISKSPAPWRPGRSC